MAMSPKMIMSATKSDPKVPRKVKSNIDTVKTTPDATRAKAYPVAPTKMTGKQMGTKAAASSFASLMSKAVKKGK